MSRFFVPPEAVKGDSIVVAGKEAHHMIDVMRLKASDSVVTFDGTGKEYVGVIKEVSRDSLAIKIIETKQSRAKDAYSITLVQALTKKEKMDYIVEKATELGAHSIVPVITERTIPDWDDAKKRSRADRWRKIAMEAAKQCGRPDIPEISAVSKFTETAKKFSDFDLKLIAILNDEAVPIKEAVKNFKSWKIVIAIGPEGDFSPGEFKAARAAGFRPISLGPRVLKSDTAGLALLSILGYEFQN